jgi:hypothetical protein
MEETQFDFSFAPGTTQEQIIGFEMAGEILSHYLTDNVTINIHVETTDQLPENIVGGALPAIQASQNYSLYRNKLGSDIKSSDDLLAYNSLTGVDNYKWLIESNGDWNRGKNNLISLTRANAKALGMVNSQDSGLDVYILMNNFNNSEYNWNYNYLNRTNIAENSVDFLSVAIHEIVHGLGFISGVDSVTTASNFVATPNRLNQTTPLDMYRYSRWSKSMRAIDLAYGQTSYFSIDGGMTKLASFSMGDNQALGYGGDGFQASHWLRKSDDIAVGIMDPILEPGELRNISRLDLRALDVIGWNLDSITALNYQQVYNNALNSVSNSAIADRTDDVLAMISGSIVYNGRNTGSGSGGGSWQAGFWQDIKFQTLDVEVTTKVAPEFYVAEMLIDRHLSEIENHTQAKPESKDNHLLGDRLNLEQTVTRLISYSDLAIIESTVLDVNLLTRLLSEKLEDIYSLNDELSPVPCRKTTGLAGDRWSVMPIDK